MSVSCLKTFAASIEILKLGVCSQRAIHVTAYLQAFSPWEKVP
jgi:hypothetical protein